MKKPQTISEIRIDKGTQPRVEIDYDVVKDYTQAIMDGATFPPMVVFYDGAQFILADGFHRWHAYSAATSDKFGPSCVEVREGGLRDAQLYACSANKDHGLRRTNEDKRHTVKFMLMDDEWCQWSNREIAKHVGVGSRLVDSVRNEMISQEKRAATKREQRASALKAQIDFDPQTQRRCVRNGVEYVQEVHRTPPDPDDGPPKDSEGQYITEHRLMEVFRATCLDDWLKAISGLRSQIKAHHGDLVCAYLPAHECSRQLKAVYDAIKASKPHTIAPKGLARKYTDIGFLTKQQYDNLPPEKRHGTH